MMTVKPHEKASEALALELITAVSEGRKVSVGWLNHYTAQVVLSSRTDALDNLNIVGIDGLLLLGLLGGRQRTSADMVVPLLLRRLDVARAILVGGRPETLAERRAAVEELLGPHGRVVAAFDGYRERPSPEALCELIRSHGANVVLLGLGAPMQESYAAVVASAFPDGGVSLTVGGFLDQIAQPGYYPAWAYPLGLNWLVRLAREPRRLWRRYSVDAVRAIHERRALRSRLRTLPSIRL